VSTTNYSAPTSPSSDTDMPLYGPDVSNNNFSSTAAAVNFVSRLPGEGFSFIEQKVSEGSTYKDPYWAPIRDWCTANDFPCIGYHYVKTDDPNAQAANWLANDGGKYAMLDFENNSGDINNFWNVVNAFNAAGVEIALSYIPHWYWQNIGSPDLTTVPGLVASNYVNGSGYASTLYPGDDSGNWFAYGGATPQILQYTDQATVAGLSVDCNAFKGSVDGLRTLLGYPTPGDTVTTSKPATEADQVSEVWDQLRGPNGNGWPQLGGLSLVDALAQVRDKVCGTNDADTTGEQ
jgi:lysozyme